MVGKLDLDLGEDYAFDIRRAKFVAEQAAQGGGAGGGNISLQPGGTNGPTNSAHGAPYWIRRSGGAGSVWYVGWDIDADPDPDVWNTMQQFNNSSPDPDYQADVNNRATQLGWPG